MYACVIIAAGVSGGIQKCHSDSDGSKQLAVSFRVYRLFGSRAGSFSLFLGGWFTPQESFEGPSRGSCELGDDFWYGTPSREGCQLNPKERHLVVARPHR
jgi:hypothetical protein